MPCGDSLDVAHESMESRPSSGVRTVRGRAFGNPSPQGGSGAGCLAYISSQSLMNDRARSSRKDFLTIEFSANKIYGLGEKFMGQLQV